MYIFKRKTNDLDLINKFNSIENKIDTLNLKFESITLLDGCCECKKRENNLYETLVVFFENKFLKLQPDESDKITDTLDKLKDNILNELKNVCKNDREIDRDNRLEIKEFLLDNISPNLKLIIDLLETNTDNFSKLSKKIENTTEETHSKLSKKIENTTEETHSKLSKLLENTTEETHNIFSNLFEQKSNQEIALNNKLRNDLNSFLIGIQSNIISQVKNNNQESINSIGLSTLIESIDKINTKVDSFFYENEIIKHQLSLEEQYRKYNDEIEGLKITIVNSTNIINNILLLYNFEPHNLV